MYSELLETFSRVHQVKMMVATVHDSSPRVAILIENQFEDYLFQVPYKALKKAGADVSIIGSRMNEEYHGKRGKVSYKPDDTATEVRADDFDGFIVPVGHIRANPFAVSLIAEAIDQDKAIAVVGYGIQVLIETDRLEGKRVTGLGSLRKDIENAGANYIGGPVIADGNLITARQPSDIAILANSFIRYLGLEIPEETPAEHQAHSFDWWKIAEDWGGSSKKEIVDALNTALETRLHNAFNDQVTWQAVGSEVYAALHSWLQSSDELSILRRALGDIQTGVVDTYHLCQQLTDPVTVSIFDEIKRDLGQYEQQLAQLYRDRSGDQIQPPIPTTIAAVS